MNDRHLYKETEIGHLVPHPGSDAVSIIYRT